MTVGIELCTDIVEPLPVMLLARELNYGGIERDVSKFARHLSQYGIAPHVGCFRPGGVRWKEIEAAGVPAVAIPLTSFKSPSAFTAVRTARSYFVKHKIRLVHGFDDAASLVAAVCGRWSRIPSLSSQLCFRNLSSFGNRMFLRATDRLSSGVFVNCNAVAEDLKKRWKVPPERIHLCYNGFEPGEFNAAGRQRPEMLRDASVVIGVVSLLREEKNLAVLVKAFAKLVPNHPAARLLIVGSGPGEGQLKELVRESGISSYCVFEPATSIPAQWMRAIDIFVLPSRSEAFSNALLEAMACGCCPVASRVGGTPELVRDGVSGFLFDPNDPDELANLLMRLTSQPDLMRQAAHEATAYVHEKLSIDVAAARLAEIYHSVAGSRMPAVPDLADTSNSKSRR
jgi:glycosyltransferase involved in cell wall biosynthesis